MKRSYSNWGWAAFTLTLLSCGTESPEPGSTQVPARSTANALSTSPAARSRLPFATDVPNEVIVKLKSLPDADELRAPAQSAGVLRHRRSPRLDGFFGRHHVHSARPVFPGARVDQLRRTFLLEAQAASAEAMATELRAMPEVEYAEPNRIHHAVYTPNDPYFASTGAWGQDYRDLWGLQLLQLETAWDRTLGSNVVVAVVDSGIDYNHSDLKANVWQNTGEIGTDAQGRDKRSNGVDDDGNGFVDDWRGYNFATYDAQARNDPMDDYGHGTHVAGIIAALGNNALGVVGVAPAAKVMAVKGLDQSGSGSDADLAAAIHYAADRGARVINASFGVFTDSGPDQTMVDAVNYAHDVKGAVVVAAAGNNNGTDMGGQFLTGAGFYPAAALNAVAVSATSHLDKLASFSNVGAKLDVAAPGGGDAGTMLEPYRSSLSLLSAQAVSDMTNQGQLVVGGQYLRQGGTSMAAPHVAGVAALLRAYRPSLSAEQVRQALRAGSDDLDPAGFDTSSGYGRVNAAKALALSAPLGIKLNGPLVVEGLAQAPVTGTASGSGFSSYRLEYGMGSAPTGWTTIATSSTQVTSGTLGNWNLHNLYDGDYVLHLVGQNTTGQTFEDRLPISLRNLRITAPIALEQTSFKGGQPVTITGNVTSPDLSRFAVRITGFRTGELANPNVTLTSGGTQPVSGTLATWNTAGIAADHYTVQVEATLTSGVVSATSTEVIVDPDLHAGWPWWWGRGASDPFYALSASDLDGDGAADLIWAQGDRVFVLGQDSTVRAGWPQPIDAYSEGRMGPVVGDINGDGVPEILASSPTGTVFAWSRDAVAVPGWPKALGTRDQMMTLADFNGDGKKEIVAVDWYAGGVRVLDASGASLPGWPVTVGGQLNQPAVADLDGDGKLEIVIASFDGTKLYVLSSTGQTKSGWPRTISAVPGAVIGQTSLPALGDLDGDGKVDVVVGTPAGSVWALRYDGTPVAGWPKATASAQVNSPAVGDLDGDGRPEVVVGINTVTENGSLVDYLYAWHGDGTALTGWPVRYAPDFAVTAFGFGAPALADVDGDGKAEAVVSSDAAYYAFSLHAFRSNGMEAPGFPKPTASVGPYPVNSVAVADFDADGLLELAWADRWVSPNWGAPLSKIVMWDLPAAKSGPQPWPMFHHDAQNTGVGAVFTPPPDGGTGGNGAGGSSSTGGSATTGGRASTGGTGSGGAPATGGRSSTGGSSTGGRSTGGASSGGSSTGGRSTGGASTGGAGSGTNPCAGLCSNPTVFTGPNYQSGNLGTSAVCRETTSNLNSGNCSNLQSRVLTINGTSMNCGGWSLPVKRNGGYCIQVTAGTPEWASFATW